MGLRIGGLATGLDTNALIDSLLSLERRPLQLAQQRKADLELEKSLFSDLNEKLLALRDAAAALDNLSSGQTGPAVEEEFLAYNATSSDEAVVRATASASATPGSTQVTVTALAGAARSISTEFASETDVIANQGETMTIAFANGDPSIELTVGAGGASLVDLRGLINNDANNDGRVRADLIDTGSGFRLVVSGLETGVANDVTLTTNIQNGAGAFVDTTQAATDAQLEVFGVAVTRPSNSVTDLVPGVSLELESAGSVEINVTVDEEAITEELQNFLSVYNEIVDFISEQSDVSEASETAGPLSGDSTLRSIQQTIQQMLTSAPEIPGNPLRTLGQIGLALDRDGRLSLDTDKLSAALADDPNAVRELLKGTTTGPGPEEGIAAGLVRVLKPLLEDTDPDNGVIGIMKARGEGFDRRIDNLDDQIGRIELRLERREELLVAQFSALESAIAALNQQGNALSSLQF